MRITESLGRASQSRPPRLPLHLGGLIGDRDDQLRMDKTPGLRVKRIETPTTSHRDHGEAHRLDHFDRPNPRGLPDDTFPAAIPGAPFDPLAGARVCDVLAP
jgi:hypothetical protein